MIYIVDVSKNIENARKRSIEYYYKQLEADEQGFRKKRKDEWKKYKDKHPERVIHKQIKNRCERNNVLFELTREDVKSLMEIKVCPICGAGEEDRKFEIDRIVPGLGYVVGNVDRICCRCNRLKSNGTVDDFKNIIKYMER